MVRLRVDDPSRTAELVSFLRRCQCDVEALGPTTLGVGLAQPIDAEALARRVGEGLCYRCGGAIEEVLFRLGSPRCQDCREANGSDAEAIGEAWTRMEIEAFLRVWRLRNPGAGVELVS